MKTNKILKVACSVASLFFMAGAVNAQSIKEVKKDIAFERYERAKADLSKLVTNKKVTAEANYYLGDIYLRTFDVDSAKYFFAKGVEADPKFSLNYVGQGKIELISKKANEAKVLFDKGMSLASKKDYQTPLEISKAYALQDAYNLNYIKKDADYDLALPYLQTAQKNGPKEAEVLCTSGDILMLRSEASLAIENYNKTLEVDKTYLAAYIGQSKIYSGARNYESALNPLNKAIELDPKYAPSYRELSRLYASSQQYDKAVDVYKNQYMPLTDSTSCNSKQGLARVYFLATKYQESYDLITALMSSCSVKPVYYRLLGYSAYETAQYTKAYDAMMQFFSRQMKAQGKSGFIAQDFTYMAKIYTALDKDTATIRYSKLNNDSMAVVMYRQAIALDPQNKENYVEAGKSSFINKEYASAIYFFDRYKKLPNVKMTLTELSYYGLAKQRIGEVIYNDTTIVEQERIAQSTKMYLSADSVFMQIVEDAPENVIGYKYRADVNSNLDPDSKKGLAKPFYEKVIELGVADTQKNKRFLVAAYQYMAGYAYTIENNEVLAKKYISDILAIDPNNKYANEVMASFAAAEAQAKAEAQKAAKKTKK